MSERMLCAVCCAPVTGFTSDQQRHLVAHRMRNLPTMMVLVEHSEHRNVQLSTQCLSCNSQKRLATYGNARCSSHEWRPARQALHMWLSTYVGPRASQVQGQRWDSAVLEQWSSATATP